jgi:hypothetical protein
MLMRSLVQLRVLISVERDLMLSAARVTDFRVKQKKQCSLPWFRQGKAMRYAHDSYAHAISVGKRLNVSTLVTNFE